MARDSEVMILNDYGGGAFQKRTRTLKSGAKRSRYTVTIKSEPLLVQTSPKALGAGPAKAIADVLKQRTADISDSAAPATIKAREVAKRAVQQGKPWAVKRYAGGRIGAMEPGRTTRLFNDSGRFVESIQARPRDDDWIINIAANRLDPNTLNGGEAALLRIMERLRELVPEWGDARQLVTSLPVRRAIADATKEMLQKANEKTAELRKQLMDQTVGRLLRLVA